MESKEKKKRLHVLFVTPLSFPSARSSQQKHNDMKMGQRTVGSVQAVERASFLLRDSNLHLFHRWVQTFPHVLLVLLVLKEGGGGQKNINNEDEITKS